VDERGDDIIGSEPPPRSRSAVRTWRLVGIGVAAVLFGLAVSLRGGVSVHDSGDADSPSPTAVSSSPAPPPIRINAADADADADWYAGGGRAAVVELTGDTGRISTEYIQQNYNALGSDCSQLGKDVIAAQAYRPMPDASAQTAWAVALGHLGLGADACVYGVSNSLSLQLSSGLDEMRTGTITLLSVETQLGSPEHTPIYGF
jgi:hypothetical protein